MNLDDEDTISAKDAELNKTPRGSIHTNQNYFPGGPQGDRSYFEEVGSDPDLNDGPTLFSSNKGGSKKRKNQAPTMFSATNSNGKPSLNMSRSTTAYQYNGTTSNANNNGVNNKIRVVIRTRPYLNGEHERLALQSNV